jgi:uncharacterized tellurite resistance protein B-like protein
MIKRLFVQVVQSITTEDPAPEGSDDRESTLRMATAVLMLDVARADHVFDETEYDRVLQLIETHFDLPPEQAAQLVNAAGDQADDLVSLHEFTDLLHDNLSAAEKATVIALLWQIAYADGRLDKYEDSLVLKISDLLHVSRGLVMRLKHDAENAAG